MQKRQNTEDRKIASAGRLRTLQGASYGDNKKTLVELPVDDQQFVIIHAAKPEHTYVQEFTLQYDLAVRILDAGGLVSIGNGRFTEEVEENRHGMLPISYDGAGMFWWLKASPVADVATAIKDDALSFVDQALARKTWNDEEEALVEARGVLSAVSGQYAVLPDNTILTGSAAPGMRLVDNGQWLFLEMFDKRSDRLRSNVSVDFASRHDVPLSFGILEYAAADEFLKLLAERNPDRKVARDSLVERRDTAWAKDFTHNRERWADGGFFTDFVSALNHHIGALRPVGNKALDAAFNALQFHTKMWLHDHDAANSKLDEILSLRDLLLESEPKFDDLLAERLKWPYKVKPLEVLEIRARGLKELIAEPAFSPSP
ncbi:hypothetical protein [Rhizobium sp. MHM7A]|uniref:hypothetical protein n=1 Tax=Rhizobium sp. MHM7A TaxID=2583233 RepID=UPI0011061DF4|nr:hypothetical protein [Rhizobium sp. MHM7A]TLX16406.1 hypothetical protein FFR93_03475 [Rhizobium sp. MHM7A]